MCDFYLADRLSFSPEMSVLTGHIKSVIPMDLQTISAGKLTDTH